MQKRKIELLVKSSRHLSIVFIVIALLMLILRMTVTNAGGTVNPNDPCPV